MPTKRPAMARHPVPLLPSGYAALLEDIKSRVRAAQLKAGLAVNHELVMLYWHVGREILARQKQEGWGAKVIDRLSRDLGREFPGMRGLSPRNLLFARSFATEYRDETIVKQLVSQLPWGHIVRLLQMAHDPAEREWYIRATVEHGWSRNVLVQQIETDLYHRQGKAVTNFPATLPAPQSDLARQVFKDPYIFDFLSVGPEAEERAVEDALVGHVTRFLLELGAGFAFVGRQIHLEVGGEDFYLDLLFYHVHLRCYVVIELKAGSFKPEHAGKLNFYISAVDSQLRGKEDGPTIGLVLCSDKNRVIAEYALRDIKKPIGVADWKTRLTRSLPRDLKPSLPTVEQLEAELGKTR